jgi:hypothetical protein
MWQHHGLTVDQWVRSLAQRRMAQTTIRLKMDQVAKGSLPDNLPDFGEAGTDPFDKKPLRYKKTKDGFLLYSVGGDGDQGGATGLARMEKNGSDIVWNVQA